MKQVGIYRTVFPIPSEAFIREQASNLNRYLPTFLMRTKMMETKFQTVSLSDKDFLRIKQTLFALTRSSTFFNHISDLSKLNLIHAHFAPDGFYALPLAEELGLPLIVTMYGNDPEYFRESFWHPWRSDREIKYQSVQFMLHEKELKAKASIFIADSHFTAGRLTASGYPQDRIVQHYIGVSTEKFHPAEEPAEERYVLCVGRHAPKKGLDVLLRAFARISSKHPEVTLVQVGAGSLTSSLHALAEELGIKDRVRFLGAQPHEAVLKLMRSAEVFALPSQTTVSQDTEGLGIVFNEASACGVPVVSTLHAGIPEAVLDGETGLLAPERDDKAVADKLDVLLSDKALARKMGRRGREYVCETFDIRKQTAKLEKIYDRVVEEWQAKDLKSESQTRNGM